MRGHEIEDEDRQYFQVGSGSPLYAFDEWLASRL
jgi:hypothetical protein